MRDATRQLYTRRRILYAAVAMLAGLATWAVYMDRVLLERSRLQAAHEETIDRAVDVVDARFENAIREQARRLASEPQVLEALSETRPTPDVEQLSEVLLKYAWSLRNIHQVRWLDETGMERARVEVTRTGEVRQFPEAELQDKSHRYYFSDTMQTPPPGTYVSAIDLNVEHGQVEVPHRPVVRVGFQTGHASRTLPGVMVLSFDVAPMLSALSDFDTRKEVELRVARSDGAWMLHPSSDQLWGPERGLPERGVAQEAPAVWSALSTHNTSSMLPGFGGFVSSLGLRLGSAAIAHPDVYLVAVTPGPVWRALLHGIWLRAGLAGLVVLLLGAVVVESDARHGLRREALYRQLREERVELAAALEHRQQLLEQQAILQEDLVESSKLASLGMMVAGVAHELNTPIGAAMLLGTQLEAALTDLKRKLATGMRRSDLEGFLEASTEGLGLQRHSLERAAGLIKSFKRLAFERDSDEVRRCSLRELTDDLAKTVRPRTKGTAVELEVDVPEVLDLDCVGGTLSQVLQNLVVNALDHGFVDRGGSGGTITIFARGFDDHVEIEVSDTGCGIDPEIRAHMFDPFVTSRRGAGNTGLGLHFVHQWVTKVLCGRLFVESAPGRGTAFRIWLPRGASRDAPDPLPVEHEVAVLGSSLGATGQSASVGQALAGLRAGLDPSASRGAGP